MKSQLITFLLVGVITFVTLSHPKIAITFYLTIFTILRAAKDH